MTKEEKDKVRGFEVDAEPGYIEKEAKKPVDVLKE